MVRISDGEANGKNKEEDCQEHGTGRAAVIRISDGKANGKNNEEDCQEHGTDRA